MLRAKPDLMPETAPTLRSHISVAGHTLTAARRRRALLGGGGHAARGRSASREGRRLRRARHAAAALRHAHHAGAAGQGRSRAVDPARVVALGDSFHRSESRGQSGRGGSRASRSSCSRAANGIWICGNHDPHLPASIGGTVCATLTIRGVDAPARAVRRASQAREIAGHLHPVARIARRGTVIRRRCFATDGNRLVMPAFGAYAGGLNVLDEAFRPLFLRHQLEAWMMGRHARLSRARQPAPAGLRRSSRAGRRTSRRDPQARRSATASSP